MTSQLVSPLPALPATTEPLKLDSLPETPARRRRPKWWLLGGAAILVVAVIAAVIYARTPRTNRVDLVTHTVQYDRLELTVVERGALESADNHDIYCRVKSLAQNSTVATTIKFVVDDGSIVKKGDILADLDESGLVEKLKAQKITMDKAEADKIKAEEDYKIQVSQNEIDIKNAETGLELAKIDLEKYLEGDYPQKLKDVEGRIKVAESDLDQQRERAAWAQRMVKKGYQTASQAQAEESKLESLNIALKKVQEERRVLIDPLFGEKKRSETDFRNKVAVAEKTLMNARSNAIAKEVQAKTLRESTRSLYLQEKSHYEEIEAEIKKCKIYAPQDGMVVYFVPEQARMGGGSQQSIVAQGEPVREGQKLMQIPDLRHMLVTTKVHEALVAKVRHGQTAKVRVDAFPDHVFSAHVETVATISSQQDWLSADVKVYAVKVAIDEEVEGLKPGMSAEVTITVGDALERVLTVPVEAIVGSVEMGGKRRCYVLDGGDTQSRDVVIGMSNDRMVEVKEGLKEGEQVVLNPKRLVGDAVKTRKPGGENGNGNGHGNGASNPAGTAPARGGPGQNAAGMPPGPGNAGGPPGGLRPDGARPAAGGPGGQGGAAGAGGMPQMSAEERQKQWQALKDSIKNAKTPDDKKQILDRLPEQIRGVVKDRLKAEGVEVP